MSIDESRRAVILECGWYARVNARYYETHLRLLERADLALRLLAALAASVSVVVQVDEPSPIAWACSATAAVLAALGPVLRISDRVRAEATTAARYVDHAARFEALLLPGGDDGAELQAELGRWRETQRLEAADVRYRSDRLFTRARAYIAARWRWAPAAREVLGEAL